MTPSSTSIMRRLSAMAAVATLVAAGALLSACNTTAGAGKDISAAGQAVVKGADDVKAKVPAVP